MGRIVLYGFHLFLAGAALYGVAAAEWALGFFDRQIFFTATALFGIALLSLVIDLGLPALFFPPDRKLRVEPINPQKVSVGMTAYNDEKAIGNAVKDFKEQKSVVGVTVIDNNCKDNTAEEAKKAGARVAKETVQGYGAASMRALKEARKKGNIVCLVEGDGTFSARDLSKLLAYLENVDMVLGTRTTAEIVEKDSQVTLFMRYGNLFMAKLIQLRYWDKLRLTDVGCTYRLIRPEALDKIMPQLKVTGHHFSPHMVLTALKNNLKIIEVPVTFKKRVGESKGVGSSKTKGLITGMRMWKMILLH